MFFFIFSVPQWLRMVLSLLYLVLIAFLSLLPPNGFPDVPLFEGADKIVHTFMYLGFTVLACWAMHAEVKPLWYYVIIFFSISWGVVMEVFQLLMHLGRSFDYFDIIGNSIGTFCGIFIYLAMARMKKKKDLQRKQQMLNETNHKQVSLAQRED